MPPIVLPKWVPRELRDCLIAFINVLGEQFCHATREVLESLTPTEIYACVGKVRASVLLKIFPRIAAAGRQVVAHRRLQHVTSDKVTRDQMVGVWKKEEWLSKILAPELFDNARWKIDAYAELRIRMCEEEKLLPRSVASMINALFADALSQRRMKQDLLARDVVIMGGCGVGKRVVADLICRALLIIHGYANDIVRVTAPTSAERQTRMLSTGVLAEFRSWNEWVVGGTRRIVATAHLEDKGLADVVEKPSSNQVAAFHPPSLVISNRAVLLLPAGHLATGSSKDVKADETALKLLHEVPSAVVVITGDPAEVQHYLSLPSMKARKPHILDIGDLDMDRAYHLAKMIIDRHGLEFENHGNDDEDWLDANDVATRGRYAVVDSVSRAVQRKNERVNKAERSWLTGDWIQGNDGLLNHALSKRDCTTFADALEFGMFGLSTIKKQDFLCNADSNDDEAMTRRREKAKEAVNVELSGLVGMNEPKAWFEALKQKMRIVTLTGDRTPLNSCMNLVLTGSPGTGKTTFARLLQRFLFAHGVLPEDKFVEMNGLDLKAETVGGTAPKVKAAIESAQGGCLFLDEAYALGSVVDDAGGAGGGGIRTRDSFSQEAIRTLLTELENNRTTVMVVIAGYAKLMDAFLRSDVGLKRRFPLSVHLPDYTPAELAKIARNVAQTRFKRNFVNDELEGILAKQIANHHMHDIETHNGGLAVTLAEKAVDRQIQRIAATSTGDDNNKAAVKTSLGVLTQHDFGVSSSAAAVRLDRVVIAADPALASTTMSTCSRTAVEKEVDMLVGCDGVKAFFSKLKTNIQYVERGGDRALLHTSLCIVLTGSPGTGKTTIARLLHRWLFAHGILPRDQFVEKNALELKGAFLGQTAPTVREVCASADGGCLFLDEAHALAFAPGGFVGDRFGGEAVQTLLTEIERRKERMLTILAGYKEDMATMLKTDVGLARRFSVMIHLHDLSCEQIAEVALQRTSSRFNLQINAEDAAHSVAAAAAIHHNNTTAAETPPRRVRRKTGDRWQNGAAGGGGGEAANKTKEKHAIVDKKQEDDPWRKVIVALGEDIASKYSRELMSMQNGGLGVQIAELAYGRLAARVVRDGIDAKSPEGRTLDFVQDFGIGDATVKVCSSGDHVMAVATTAAAKSAHQRKRKLLLHDDAVDAAGGGVAPPPPKLTLKDKDKQTTSSSSDESGDEAGDGDEQSKLRAIGLCPQGFNWSRIFQLLPTGTCGLCAASFAHGWRCEGGTHYVCATCLQQQ